MVLDGWPASLPPDSQRVPSPVARFTKDGRERDANTPADAVKLRFAGWREVTEPAPPAETDETDETPETDETEGALPRGTTDD